MEEQNNGFASEPIAVGYDNVTTALPRERLFALLSKVSTGDIPAAIKYLAGKLVDVNETASPATAVQKHVWDNYQLSPEILSIIPDDRKSQPKNYKDDLTDILEEKYK